MIVDAIIVAIPVAVGILLLYRLHRTLGKLGAADLGHPVSAEDEADLLQSRR